MYFDSRPGLKVWPKLVAACNAIWILLQIALGCGIIYAALLIWDVVLN